MNTTPESQRTVIAIAGPCNSGKSSLLNAICGHTAALVSPEAGTTTDPVRKAVELPEIGPALMIDTPGLDDNSRLGAERVALAMEQLARADMIILTSEPGRAEQAAALAAMLRPLGRPTAVVLTKSDLCDAAAESADLAKATAMPVTAVSALSRLGVDSLLKRLASLLPDEERSLLGNLVEPGQTVVLVMPQDPQAPKGRLILPQSLTLRELLGRECTAICCTPGNLRPTLASIKRTPDLVITDSQVFGPVSEAIPEGCRLTSFSVLMAAYKGDISLFVKGAEAIEKLGPDSRILIAEACSHIPVNEDIGRVKLPRMLRRRLGEELAIDIVGGKDFPADLSSYDLVVHCGGCMFTRRHVVERVRRAERAGVPVTNYGILIARLSGILDRVVLPE